MDQGMGEFLPTTCSAGYVSLRMHNNTYVVILLSSYVHKMALTCMISIQTVLELFREGAYKPHGKWQLCFIL